MRWRSYVAVGDSFTEGMNDHAPDGTFRGWADIVAHRLADEHRAARAPGSTEEFTYANLAIRGRLFDRIVDEQVPLALTMRPDLISFAGGGNDVLRRRFVPATLIARFDDVIRTLRASGSDVIVFRWANVTTRLPGRRMIMPRMALLNQAVQDVVDRHGAMMVDLWHDEEFHNPLLWSDDRLHMAPVGHHRVAAHVLTALGLTPDPTWFDSPGRPVRASWPVARANDVRWARQYLAPWIQRRLKGVSSGDLITAKRPSLTPVVRPDGD